MKYMHMFLMILVFTSSSVFADDDSDNNDIVGENKAITAIKNKGEEFKLSKESIGVLDIKWKAIVRYKDAELVSMSKESLVRYRDKKGVYILRGNWFQLLHLEIVQKNKKTYIVKVQGILDSDLIVYEGVSLLRIAHVAALGGLKDLDID